MSCLCTPAGMEQAKEVTEDSRKIVVQQTRICCYGEARYKLDNALTGQPGYSLTENFKNAVQRLPLQYNSEEEYARYTRFLDEWGTVRRI